MIKFSKLAIAAALAGGFSMAAQADPVSITTPNGVVSGITAFDWAPSPVLAQNGNQAFVDLANGINDGVAGVKGNTFGNQFTVYSQGRLSAFLGGTGATAQLFNGSGNTANKYEITFELAYDEIVYFALPVFGQNLALFDLAATQTTNFFRIFVKDLDATAASNYAAGTGFNTGTMVFEGTIGAGGAGTTSTFLASTNLGLVGGDNDPSNGSGPFENTPSVTGSGATPEFDLLTVTPTVYDTNFWNVALTSFVITNISQNLPFQSVDASAVIVGQVPNIGLVNGGSAFFDDRFFAAGPDILFQTDFNGVARGIPEPGTLALAGLALGALSLARRRKA
jgi:hypothetical protein